MKQKGRIIHGEGMGGFLCPPGHPMHDYRVETDLRRKPENRSMMSLQAAVDCEWLDDAARGDARTILAAWEANKKPLDSPAVQEWILQVLGYFRDCYCRSDGSREDDWHTDNLVIPGQRGQSNKPLPVERHAGVHCIRRYYPEYKPTAAHFAGAYWGKKPRHCEKCGEPENAQLDARVLHAKGIHPQADYCPHCGQYPAASVPEQAP